MHWVYAAQADLAIGWDEIKTILPLLIGLVLVFGTDWLVGGFTHWVRTRSGVPTEKNYVHVPSWILGIFERSLAFILVALAVPGTAIILIAWMAAKIAVNWQSRNKGSDEEVAEIRTNTMIVVLGGTLSVHLGAMGGLIARATI